MSNVTYWEARQRAYLKCSRELRAIACSYLNDCTEAAEFRGDTARWALTNAVNTAKKAREVEQTGYEEGLLDPRTVTATMKSQDEYHKALDRFHSLLASWRQLNRKTDAEALTSEWLKPPAGLRGPDYVTDEDGSNPRDVYSGEPLDL